MGVTFQFCLVKSLISWNSFLNTVVSKYFVYLVGLIVCKNRTPNLTKVHYDVYRHVVPHLCPHIYPRFPMYVFVCNHRVSYHKMVSLSQLSLILLSGDVAVNPGLLIFGFANCHYIRNKSPLLADEVKSGGYDVFGLTETHIKAHDTPFFLQEFAPDDFSLVHTSRANKKVVVVLGFSLKKHLNPKTLIVLQIFHPLSIIPFLYHSMDAV